MALFPYSRDVSDFSAGCSLDRFELEIRQSPYISIALDSIGQSGSNLVLEFKAALTTPEEAALDQIIAAHTGMPLVDPRNADGVPLVALYGSANKVQSVGREGEQAIWSTHNFCDPTTWYAESVRVSNEVLAVVVGETLIYESVNAHWIDMTHGKVLAEEDVIAADVADGGPGWSIIISDNGVVKTQRTPFAPSGGDYWVEYTGPTAGKARIHFAVEPTGPVEASYSKATGSAWYLAPLAGKKLAIEDVEAQFTTDVVMNDSFIFAADVPYPVPGDPGHRLLIPTRTYKTMRQIIDEARGAYPAIPPIGGSNGRGTTNAAYGFPFQYKTVRDLVSTQGVRLCVKLANDVAFGGEFVTATFYCTSTDI